MSTRHSTLHGGRPLAPAQRALRNSSNRGKSGVPEGDITLSRVSEPEYLRGWAASGTCRIPDHRNGQRWCCRQAPCTFHQAQIARSSAVR